MIADAYESLDKIEGWTERDKQQLEEEVKSIIDGKGQKTREVRQKKLKIARKNRETAQPPRRDKPMLTFRIDTSYLREIEPQSL